MATQAAQVTAKPRSELGSRANKRLLHGTLKDLPDLQHRDELTGPVMVIIGDAVAGANFKHSVPLVRSRETADAASQGA